MFRPVIKHIRDEQHRPICTIVGIRHSDDKVSIGLAFWDDRADICNRKLAISVAQGRANQNNIYLYKTSHIDVSGLGLPVPNKRFKIFHDIYGRYINTTLKKELPFYLKEVMDRALKQK